MICMHLQQRIRTQNGQQQQHQNKVVTINLFTKRKKHKMNEKKMKNEMNQRKNRKRKMKRNV